MARKRYSDNFERDWAFYVRNADAFAFSGSHPPEVERDAGGPDAKRAFHDYDSRGVLRATSEPDLLRRVLICKASVNLHVKMWAEGLADGTLWAADLLGIVAEFEPPPWVIEAVWRQAARLHAERAHATPERPAPAAAAAAGLPTQMHTVSALCRLATGVPA